MKSTLTLIAVVITFGSVTYSASAKTLTPKQRYYHASGIVKWIGSHARFTQYSPNFRKKQHWQRAVRFWSGVRDEAWKAMHPVPSISQSLQGAFLCIHRFEGAWNANTGNGYYGGLQMDVAFQTRYGAEYVQRWGTADNWPTWAQISAAVRAYKAGRGFYPWPNTARACGLI